MPPNPSFHVRHSVHLTQGCSNLRRGARIEARMSRHLTAKVAKRDLKLPLGLTA